MLRSRRLMLLISATVLGACYQPRPDSSRESPCPVEAFRAGDLEHRVGPIEILSGAVATSARRYEKNGPLHNALRNTGPLALHYMGVRHETLARMYL